MATKETVQISLVLDRALWSRLRAVSEMERDAGGRASLRNVIVRVLEDRFAEAPASAKAAAKGDNGR